MFGELALPRFRAGLSGIGHGPEAPRFLAGRRVVGGDESAHPLVAAGRAGDDQIAHHQRRGRAVVVLAPIRHLGVPQQLAVEAVDGDHVRVIGEQEQTVAGDRDAAIDPAGGVADQSLGAGTLVMPHLAAAAGIERVHFIRARDIHDPVDHNRRRFDVPDVRNREHPARRQPRDVALVDLRSAWCSGCRRDRRDTSSSRAAT